MLEKEEFELTDEGVTEEDLFYLDESQEANKINSDIDFDGVLNKDADVEVQPDLSKSDDVKAEEVVKEPKISKKKKTEKKPKTSKKTEPKVGKKKSEKTSTSKKTKKAVVEDSVPAESSEKVAGISNSDLISSLNTIKNNQSDNKDALLQEFKNLKENFVMQMAQFFENISFAEDSEDIKDHISQTVMDNKYELLDEVRQNISDQVNILISSQSDSNTNIESLKQSLSDQIFDLINNHNDLKFNIDEIKSKLDIVVETQEKDEYSMPELEADIANLRLMLSGLDAVVRDEVAKNDRLSDIANKFEPLEMAIDRVEKEFSDCSIHDLKNILEVISEDTTSISKRTNKLILTSDDTSKDLKKNVEEFQKVIGELTANINEFDIANVKRNLEKLNISVNSILKSNKVMNEAFMHLAEWIDATSDIFDSLKHNSELLATSVQNKEHLVLNLLEEKFEDFDERLAAIEEHLASSKAKAKKGLDGDLKTTIDFIASQAAAANENSREIKTLYQKIEMVEFQLNKFDKNISKILSYIDED